MSSSLEVSSARTQSRDGKYPVKNTLDSGENDKAMDPTVSPL